MDLAEKHPDKVDVTAALSMLLQVLRVPNYDELLRPDEAMKANQQKMAELEVALKEAEIAKLKSEQAENEAKTTESFLRGMFSAMQAANLAQDTKLAIMGDSIYKSAGGKDFNGDPIADWQAGQSITQQPMIVEKNSSPGFPSLPDNGAVPQPDMPEQIVPDMPSHGVNRGIETMKNEVPKTILQ
jgi:hypothetical protein